MNFNVLRLGEAAEAADLLDNSMDIPNPTELRAALVNSLRRIAHLERCLAELQDAREFVTDIAGQKPEKPDYWSSCGQCERNTGRADDYLDKWVQPSDQLNGD